MSDLSEKICALASPDLSAPEIATLLGCDRSAVYRCIERFGLTVRMRKPPGPRQGSLKQRILSLSDGALSSLEISTLVGCSAKHVQNVLRNANAARLSRGGQRGEQNHFYKCGRSIDLDGYALVRAPAGHPYARSNGQILEHRLVAEIAIGRHLTPEEVVDHIDGLHLHNAPSNLRVFPANTDHLHATISGKVPNWSEEALRKQRVSPNLRSGLPRIDIHRQRRARGDVRLRQILLAASKLGIASHYLSGTHRHLETARIDYSTPTKIERALADLFP